MTVRPDSDLRRVSAGDHDIVRQVLERRGEILFWRLAVKPGRPLALGRFGDTPVIGLPGNPAAAVMMFHVAALPLLRVLEGGSLPRPLSVPVVLDFAHRKKPERVEYVRVRVAPDAQGQLRPKSSHAKALGSPPSPGLRGTWRSIDRLRFSPARSGSNGL